MRNLLRLTLSLVSLSLFVLPRVPLLLLACLRVRIRLPSRLMRWSLFLLLFVVRLFLFVRVRVLLSLIRSAFMRRLVVSPVLVLSPSFVLLLLVRPRPCLSLFFLIRRSGVLRLVGRSPVRFLRSLLTFVKSNVELGWTGRVELLSLCIEFGVIRAVPRGSNLIWFCLSHGLTRRNYAYQARNCRW